MGDELYAYAIEYQKMGLIVQPLKEKIPIISDWQNKEMPSEEQLKKWFLNTDNNIGLQCGRRSNVIVIDFDHELFKNDVFNGISIITRISGRTNGRGHVYFRYTPLLKASKHHDLGIEVLSDGNNAVMPPSIHPSGDKYKWVNKDAPISEMPEQAIKNLNRLFRSETELKQFISKCRHCFRSVLKTKPDMHGADGRELMLAVCTDLKAAGATEPHIKMFARLLYGKDYDEKRTLTEWNNIDASKTWKCDTVKAKFPAFVGETCEKCSSKKQMFSNSNHKPIKKSNRVFDYIEQIMEKTPLYYDDAGIYWIWTEGNYYKRCDKTEILLTLLTHIADPAIIQNTFKHELLEAARLLGRATRVKPVPAHWIHVLNGVYDVKAGELFEATPEYLFTEPIPHKTSESEETPTIDKLFASWVKPEKVVLLNEWAAYCLYNGYPIHRMMLMIGRGRNGKGQYRDFLVRFVGEINRCASSLEQLINSRFESARLYHKKICTMGEINYTLLDRTAILKMLSGGDPIPGEFKGVNPFDFVNYAKMTLNTNSLPQTSDKTDAFYSRCLTLEFVNQFLKGKDIIDTIPDSEYDNFLTKSLRVLRELLERGEFTNEGSIQDKEREYERLSNPLTQFININYEKNINGKVAAWRIYDGYLEYCTVNGYLKPRSKQNFNEMLKTIYEIGDRENLYDDVTGKQANWVWVHGIKPVTHLPSLPNLPKSPLTPYTEHPSENLGNLGNSGKNSLPIATEKTQNLPNIVASNLGKKQPLFQDFGTSARDWCAMNSKTITNENLTQASIWIAERLKTFDVLPSDVREYLIKEYKLTPETKNETV